MDLTQLNTCLSLVANGLLIIAIPIVIAFLFQWLASAVRNGRRS